MQISSNLSKQQINSLKLPLRMSYHEKLDYNQQKLLEMARIVTYAQRLAQRNKPNATPLEKQNEIISYLAEHIAEFNLELELTKNEEKKLEEAELDKILIEESNLDLSEKL